MKKKKSLKLKATLEKVALDEARRDADWFKSAYEAEKILHTATKEQLAKSKAQAEVELLKARTQLLSAIGQSFEAVSKAAMWAIGKEQL